ncbi:MAG: HEAT repeat domain-containing protein [Candidatus Hodarchaeota archaeon]
MEQDTTDEKLDKISEFLEQCKKSKEHDHQLPLTLLLDLAEDNNPRVRWRAIEALGVLKDEEKSLNALIDALQDPNNIVRWNAALALGEKGDARATLPLLSILQDDSKDVREMANWSLIELGVKAVPFLID